MGPHLIRASAAAAATVALCAAGCRVDRQPASGGGLQAETRVSPGAPSGVEARIARARDHVFPALVHVDAVTAEHWGGKTVKRRSTGSGTIISADGHVLTNAHVTDNGTNFWCTLANKWRVPAKLVGEDPFTDLAVLKINREVVERAGESVRVATFGDSSALRTGDYVLAMGSPLALSRSVTLGVVSNTERVFTRGLGDGTLEEMTLGGEQRTGLFTNWIQHDALINPGNSGGPLVDLGGRIVGVNTRGGASIGFATPSNLARSVAESLIARGEVERSTIGVTLRHIQDTGIDEGVLIDSVESASAAAGAGLRAGDVILSLDGESLSVRFPEQIPPLLKRIADAPVGTTIDVAFLRDGSRARAGVVTQKLLRDKGDQSPLRNWGMTVQRITERTARALRLADARGVLVSSIRPGSTASLAEPSISGGDIIRAIDGTRTETLDDAVAAYERIAAMEKPPEFVLVEFERQGKSYVTLVKAKPDKAQDPPRELPKSWVGVATQPVLANLAQRLGPGFEPGHRITRVYPQTNAARSGLAVGDVITAVNGERLRPRGPQDTGAFTRAVRALPVESPVELAVIRGTDRLAIALATERGRTTPEEARRDRNTDFELTVREITFFDRDDNRWDDSVRGVLVDQVESAGWAGLAGISSGDLIQRIGDADIGGIDDFRAVMERLAKDQPVRVVFVVLRGVRTSFRFAEPTWAAPPIQEGK